MRKRVLLLVFPLNNRRKMKYMSKNNKLYSLNNNMTLDSRSTKIQMELQMIENKSARLIKKSNMFLPQINFKPTNLWLKNLPKGLGLLKLKTMRKPKLNIRVRFRTNQLQNLRKRELSKVKSRQESRYKSRVKAP
jgi:hypothetical protein